jgi:alpha-ketoglutarate-dependent taurine dioxygenase
MKLHPTDIFDNGPAHTDHIQVTPLSAAMGAEIGGADVHDLDEEQFAEIKAALFRHKMIVFRDQRLSHAEHEAFSLRFGPFAVDAYTDGVPGHRNVHPVIKEADDASKHVFGEGWHTDSAILPQPPSITILRSVEVPPWGGDTMWCDSALAYRSLSDTYRRMIGELKVRFSIRDILQSAQRFVEPRDNPMGRLAATTTVSDDLMAKIRGSAHPLVRTHPVTREKALYIDSTSAIGIEGMTDEEAGPIMAFLNNHLVQNAFSCRLRWAPDMLAIWDNRLCVHHAYNDYQGFRRELYRTTVAGETPA